MMVQVRFFSLAIHIIFFLSGASALIYEIIWSRYLTLVFGNSIFSISIILSSFMAGLALGGLYGGRLIDQKKNALKIYILLELTIGLYALVLPVIFSIMPELVQNLNIYIGDSFFTLTLQRTILAFLILLFPTTLISLIPLGLATGFPYKGKSLRKRGFSKQINLPLNTPLLAAGIIYWEPPSPLLPKYF